MNSQQQQRISELRMRRWNRTTGVAAAAALAASASVGSNSDLELSLRSSGANTTSTFFSASTATSEAMCETPLSAATTNRRRYQQQHHQNTDSSFSSSFSSSSNRMSSIASESQASSSNFEFCRHPSVSHSGVGSGGGGGVGNSSSNNYCHQQQQQSHSSRAASPLLPSCSSPTPPMDRHQYQQQQQQQQSVAYSNSCTASPRSPRTPRSPRSPMTPRSPRTPHSPRSPRSPRSPPQTPDLNSCSSPQRRYSSRRRSGAVPPAAIGNLARLASRRSSRDSEVGEPSPLQCSRNTQRRTSNFLEIPDPVHFRPRVCSLPEKPYNPRSRDDALYRLRNFSITSKGVVNRGDAIISRQHSRSNTSINSTLTVLSSRSDRRSRSGERSPFGGSCCGSSYVSSEECSIDQCTKYRVVMLGAAGVGKTALVSQFMTSEYMNTYDASLDDEFGEKTVSVLLDGEESEMIFIDHASAEMSVENCLTTYDPHAFVLVYSITDRGSFQFAEEILKYLWQEACTKEKVVILVGNKVDLARSRIIKTDDGKQLAMAHDCKFIETSSGIQHNVDELLVGVLKQIRLREDLDKKRRKKKLMGGGSRTSLSLGIARDILQKMCLQDNRSKSCENLLVL